MSEHSQHASRNRNKLHLWLTTLLRILAGTTAIVAIAAYVHNLHAGHPVYYVSGTKFAVVALFSALAGYFVCRCFFGRFSALLAAVLFAGMAGSQLLWRKGDGMREFAILGMLVACSAFLALGWLDRRNLPFVRRMRCRKT